MGNNHSGTYPSLKPRKNVHWKSAERPSQPGKPDINPIISEEEQNAIILKWDPPKSDGGTSLVGYQVECNRLGTTVWIRTSPPVITKAELILTGLEPGYKYQFRVSAENAIGVSEPSEYSDILNVSLDKATVTVPKFISGLRDVTTMENEKVEFSVSFDGAPPPTIAWFKDGYEIFSSRRTAITTDRNTSILIFHQTSLNDEGEIKCTATNRAGHVITRARFQIESVPKIRLPRQYEDGLLYEINETIFFKVSVAGKPTPAIEWRHNGKPLISNDRIDISNTDKFSALRISSATRQDRGEYHIYASNIIGDDVASFLVTITAKPDKPGPITAKLMEENAVLLSWQSPTDDGGCKIGNYIIEYYRTGWDVWLKATTCRKLTTIINDLIEGSEYRFRVKAESPYGVSVPSTESIPIFIPGKSLHLKTVDDMLIESPANEVKPLAIPRRKRLSSLNGDSDNQIQGKTLKTSTNSFERVEFMQKEFLDKPTTGNGVQKTGPGSSEFMLVLFPDSGKTEKRKSFQLDLEDALTPPPLSLSAPELGTTHFLPMRPLRNSVSSTELLHEHAMDRFYQAMAIKEALTSKAKRDSITAASVNTPEIKIHDVNNVEEELISKRTKNYYHEPDDSVTPNPKSQLDKENDRSSENWKAVSFDEDYTASTASSEGSVFTENDSLLDDTERNLDLDNEQTTYHPKEMTIVSKVEHLEDDDDTGSKTYPLCDPNFIPKPILKRRQNQVSTKIDENKEVINKNSKLIENKPEKLSLFKKITKPQFPKSFSIMKRDSKQNKNSKIVDKTNTILESKNEKIKPNNETPSKLFDETGNTIDDIDGGRIVIEHYGNIVKEYGQTKKAQAQLYINTDQLKEAAALQEQPRSVKPKLEHVKKKGPPIIVKSQKKSTLKSTANNGSTIVSKNTSQDKNVKEIKKTTITRDNSKTESVLRATIMIPKDYSELESEAKETVHSAIDYTIDVVMLLVAFWLFVFKDERLAVPVLMITVYRQLHEALGKLIPAWVYDKLKGGK